MINEFRGEYRWLSNFWFCKFTWRGMTWDCTERAYMWAKSDNPEDKASVLAATTFKDIKAAGRKVKLRNDWEDVKDNIMYEVVRAKFFQNPVLAEKLLATGNQELIEGNTWGDTYWGVCNGVGKNMLGKILMRVRQELIASKRT
jgi:ribA/ribD-fused uncharacterized protein